MRKKASLTTSVGYVNPCPLCFDTMSVDDRLIVANAHNLNTHEDFMALLHRKCYRKMVQAKLLPLYVGISAIWASVCVVILTAMYLIPWVLACPIVIVILVYAQVYAIRHRTAT